MLFSLIALPLVAAAPFWQPVDSDVAKLFVRQNGVTPDPNSPGELSEPLGLTTDFASHFPKPGKTPPPDSLPAAWTKRLAEIHLPDCPVSHPSGGGGSTKYDGKDGMDPSICSFTFGCHTKEDFFDAPDGTFVLTFDDGPTEASPTLYKYLSDNKINEKATHFMIGSNVVTSPKQALEAFKNGGHLAVHTWSHNMTTGLTNEGVLAELGWTMQAIADVTGGRIPAYWRPPYGDVDNRVRAIAKQVFGMETVLWNRDTNDWKIGQSGTTVESVGGVMEGWFKGSKTPGVLALEHELNDNVVKVFMNQYPHAAENGWAVKSVPDAYGLRWYLNSPSNNGTVTPYTIAVDQAPNLNATAEIPPASTAAPSSSSSASSSSATAAATPEPTTPSTGQHNKNAAGARAVPVLTLMAAAAAAIAL